jgi:hypothetical protein
VSHQVQRIDQIILRYHIRQNGFIRRFEVGGILHDLEITNDQLKCLGNIKELIATELDAAAEEIRGEVEKRILDHLNVAQREHLKQIMIDLNINKPQSLDLMAAQIDHCEQFIQMADHFQIDCCMSFLDPFFEIDLKGNLIVVRNPGEKLVVGVDEKNAEAMQDWIFFNGVVTGISQKELHSELGLSIRQVSKIEDLVDEIRMQCTMISRPPTGVFGDPDEFVKWLECMYINQTGLISEFSPTLTLLIKQFDERKFSEYRIRSEITRLGLTFSLTAGQLASVLDVSEDQKRAIRSELDEFVDYISKNTIEEEEKALNKLLECLDQNQRQQFDSLVCKQLRASRANLGVFAEQLRGPSKR